MAFNENNLLCHFVGQLLNHDGIVIPQIIQSTSLCLAYLMLSLVITTTSVKILIQSEEDAQFQN